MTCSVMANNVGASIRRESELEENQPSRSGVQRQVGVFEKRHVNGRSVVGQKRATLLGEYGASVSMACCHLLGLV